MTYDIIILSKLSSEDILYVRYHNFNIKYHNFDPRCHNFNLKYYNFDLEHHNIVKTILVRHLHTGYHNFNI